MAYQPDEFEDTWAGLEPVQPRSSAQRWLIWLSAAFAVLLVLCLCVAGGYLLYQQSPEPAPLPPPPEISTPVTVAPPDPTQPSTPIGVSTATLAIPVATTPPPLVGSGNVEALRVAAAPLIDGDLSEWNGYPTFESAHVVHRAPGQNRDPNIKAVWRLGWDDQHLYIGVEVTDPVHVQTQTGNQIFRGDSLDMQFETNPARRGSRLGPSNFQIIFSPGDFATLPPSAFRFRGNEQGQIPDAPGHNIRVAAQKTAAGYNLEAAIPWADINVTPSPGLVLGVALNANDNDTPGTAVQEMMMSHVPTRTLTNPTTWGTLTLR